MSALAASPAAALPDARCNPYRADLAAEYLRGTVEAARYVVPERAHVSALSAPLLVRPDAAAPNGSELLLNERVDVLETKDGFAWVQSMVDGYVGYVRADALAAGEPPVATHRIAVCRSLVFAGPSVKTTVLGTLGLSLGVTVLEEEGKYARLAGAGWVYRPHLIGAAENMDDLVGVAELFLGVPYLWGGRSGVGLDCSGLAQICLAAIGRTAPRDADMQQAVVGTLIGTEWEKVEARRGDLLFFPGHVGIAIDATTMIHANQHRMMVTIDPITDVIGRSGGFNALRRL